MRLAGSTTPSRIALHDAPVTFCCGMEIAADGIFILVLVPLVNGNYVPPTSTPTQYCGFELDISSCFHADKISFDWREAVGNPARWKAYRKTSEPELVEANSCTSFRCARGPRGQISRLRAARSESPR